MSLQARAERSADRLIAHFGSRKSGQLTATITPKGSYSASTGAVGSAGTALTVNISEPTPVAEVLVDGELVEAEDLVTYVSRNDPGLTSNPDTDQHLTVDSTTYQLVEVMRHAGAFELRLRG